MRYTALVLAIAAIAMTSTPSMARDHHHNNNWQNGRYHGYRNHYNAYNNPYDYNPYPNGVRAPNGTWVDGTRDAHGNPAWAGGAFR